MAGPRFSDAIRTSKSCNSLNDRHLAGQPPFFTKKYPFLLAAILIHLNIKFDTRLIDGESFSVGQCNARVARI